MHPHAALIAGFYTAFQRRDHAAMGICYAPDATFRDPVFQLHGWRVPAMWQMLCERATDLQISFANVRADDASGAAEWEARYTFSTTGRPVYNRIRATFQFRGERIIAHQDRFSLWRWSAQALGARGQLLGWVPPVRRVIRRQAAKALEVFIRERGLAPGGAVP
jgi:ketosteroid isomerase-like protein